MIRVKIAEIEKLTDILVKIASDSDEVFSRLRQISGEMNNDIELSTYSQSKTVLEAISGAFEALNRGNDTLQSLKNTMLPVASIYQENEQKSKEALNRMTVVLNNVGTGYNATLISATIPLVEHNDDSISQGKVQQLVTDSVTEMRVTNIAALTKAVREEYKISKVEELKEQN